MDRSHTLTGTYIGPVFFAFLIAALMTACLPQVNGGQAGDQSSTTSPTQSTVATAIPQLTVEILKNARYFMTGQDGITRDFQLVNGLYKSGSDPAAIGYAMVNLSDTIAFGDMNNDGLEDAAVLLAENYGGTGVFVSLVTVLNNYGTPVQVASTLIDDRPSISNLTIEQGSITVDAVIHHIDDPMCCPTLPVKQFYRLMGNTLLLVHLTSQTPGGGEHAITIDTPEEKAELAGSIPITGDISISPFENTLALSFYDGSGVVAFKGPLSVSATDMGAPGQFDAIFESSALNLSSGSYRIEVAELSMADGSVIAMDSVFVTLK